MHFHFTVPSLFEAGMERDRNRAAARNPLNPNESCCIGRMGGTHSRSNAMR